MSEPDQRVEDEDRVAELPSVAGANAGVHDHRRSPTVHSQRPTNGRSRSRSVDVDFFDPEGVYGLRRTISQMSGAGAQPPPSHHADSVVSDVTLGPDGGPFDFAKVLREIMEKVNKTEARRRELGVSFKNLRVVGVGASATYQPTLGSLVNPMNIVAKVNELRHPALRDILSGFEGAVRPGEMLLVLGRPGAGCSTLLRTLANQRSDYYAVEGEVHYDSFTPQQIEKHYRGDVQYCPEDDIHFPTLTVGQTLAFAAKTRTPHVRIENETRSQYIDHVTEILGTIFGLRHVKDTLVGDASIRGISGGEKKRVSISEALATRSCLTSWDNSTRGLDASTALEFVQALRIATDIARMSTIVSIYQAGESLYEHFDKVCVIYEGKMAYFGPADRARQYFIDMGYEPANRQTTADFLVAVTDPNGRFLRSGFESRAPRNAIEFAEYFSQSEIANINRDDIDSYEADFVGKPERVSAYIQSAHAERARHTRPKSPYIISIPMQVRALVVRRAQIVRGGYTAQAMQLATFVLQGIIVGTVFLDLPKATSAYFSRGGVLFFSILFAALSTMAEIPALFSQRPIVLRHYRAAMYHPFAESLALTIVDIPITLFIIVIFSIVIYFLVGLQRSAGQFFIFMLFVFSMTITMKAWFRALAAAFKSAAPAQTVAGISVLILSLYTGYSIPQPSMIGALRWITYINPLRYGFESLMVNEFHTLDGQCSTLVPSGPSYDSLPLSNKVCTTVGSLPGQSTVSGSRYLQLSFGYMFSHLWRNFGIVCAFLIGFLIAYLTFTEFNTKVAGQTSVTLFKRGSKSDIVKDASSEVNSDEEKQHYSDSAAGTRAASETNAKEALEQTPDMSHVYTWKHLSYTVPVHGGSKRLLDDVSGFVSQGLTALMGESGAGKTTLLNVLAQRVDVGVVTGERYIDGKPVPADFQAQTGYVQQMDTHLPSTTVREALLFSAKMRQPASVPLAEKEAYVEKCLKMCGLEAYGDAIVGSLGVEHRKRTTIGVELAAKPRLLLFLDEPTSGLDSQSAWAIMTFLRSLADNGQAILCTIHQPSAELFQVFDRLLLLRKGGQTVYFGDLGPNSSTLINYFERNGSRKCGPSENPAEFILSAIGAGATATSEIDWYDVWNKSPEAEQLLQTIERLHAEGRKRPAVETTLHGEFSTSWTYQVGELYKRDVKAHWRDPTYLMSKIMLNICAGLLIGFTFWKAKDTVQGTQNKVFAIFMATIVSVPLANQLQVPFLDMRKIYEIRERPSRMYSWSALVTSQMMAEIPWNILGSSLFFLCWFWTVGFPTSRGGYTYLMQSLAFPLYYTTIGQAVAAMSPNAEIAALLFSFLFSFVLIFDGVLQPFRQLGWWRWMYRVSPYTYLIEGLLGQAIGRQQVNCAPLEYVTLTPPSGQSCSSYMQPFIDMAGGYLNPNSSSCQYCAFRTTDQFMVENFNVHYSHRWRNVGIFAAYILFNIAAIYFFTWFFRIRSGSILAWIKMRFGRRRS